MSLAACSKSDGSGGSEEPKVTDNNSGVAVANTGDGKDFPLGLIRISDTGDGKIVFIVDTALIDDDLSGVVQCSINLGEYSVNYNYEMKPASHAESFNPTKKTESITASLSLMEIMSLRTENL